MVLSNAAVLDLAKGSPFSPFDIRSAAAIAADRIREQHASVDEEMLASVVGSGVRLAQAEGITLADAVTLAVDGMLTAKMVELLDWARQVTSRPHLIP